MRTWKFQPIDQTVAKFINCYWCIEKESSDITLDNPILNPDPSATLIIAPDEQHYCYQNSHQIFSGVGCHWLFPNSQSLQLDHSKPFHIIGIKFHVGALYSLHKKPATPKLDLVEEVNFMSLFNNDNIVQSNILDLSKNNEQLCIELMDELILSWVKNSKLDKQSELVRKAIPLLSTTPVSNIGSQLNCSQRTIERNFSRVTGLTLKQCQSMNRFEEVLSRLYQLENQPVNWLDIVDEFGFSDQPHLINYIKNIIGKTPNEYLKKRDITIDIYGDFESKT
ncbi:helix-turn-helix domain-containing protein [Colwellia sp. 1_MG-2023]|uniref:helix-turn-helix domain-containing protein n=1 Tax=Colwellia sp. 1_MG-2023 TaxID=3062649 RepID=UPI0026E2CC6C|nr:helix-turn-helix domain-containing protein [Colwellia sp. 1_MG-2023]MDO6445119.1 helix-turn-helix domain-containing protein [Colwellia sp. 1_MG-2023]